MTKQLPITSEISKDIVLKLMEGTPLTTICQAKGLPSLSRVYKEIQSNKDFAQEILTARRIGSQTYLDRMVTELDTMDNRNVMVVRERLQHYRWLASKLLGQIYGDKKEVQVDQKIEISWSSDGQDKSYENEIKNVSELGSIDATNKVSHTS